MAGLFCRLRAMPELFCVLRAGWLLLLAALMMVACESPPPPPAAPTLDDILRTGEITVITRNNGQCYYLYRGEKRGFEYDLAQLFADELGVRLKVKIADSWEGMIPSLMNGEGHFIAAAMTITPSRQQQIAFSQGYLDVRQQIIVNRNNGEVRDVKDLNGRMVHVRRGTSYQERLEELREFGLDVYVVTHPDMPTEELIRMVAEDEIEITIADSNIAQRNRRYYPRAIVADSISDLEQLGWAVHPEATSLLHRINQFFEKIKKNGTFEEIYNRYHEDVEAFDYVDLNTFHRRLETRLPRYRKLIETTADRFGFDWRLIAAQIYQESHFNPAAKSHAGAYGLMQLTKTVARKFNVQHILNPRENVEAGVRYLKDLYDHFDQAIGDDRMFIALAAYNVGQGHIWDAKNLARQMNLDPNKWDSLRRTLPLLSYSKYHKYAKYGYARGLEPVRYIKQISIYYDILTYRDVEIGNKGPSEANVDPGVPAQNL